MVQLTTLRLTKQSLSIAFAIIFSLIGVGLMIWSIISWESIGLFLLLLGLGFIFESLSNLFVAFKIKRFGDKYAYKVSPNKKLDDDNKKAFNRFNIFISIFTVIGILLIISGIIAAIAL